MLWTCDVDADRSSLDSSIQHTLIKQACTSASLSWICRTRHRHKNAKRVTRTPPCRNMYSTSARSCWLQSNHASRLPRASKGLDWCDLIIDVTSSPISYVKARQSVTLVLEVCCLCQSMLFSCAGSVGGCIVALRLKVNCVCQDALRYIVHVTDILSSACGVDDQNWIVTMACSYG